jgi:hypothetical protein
MQPVRKSLKAFSHWSISELIKIKTESVRNTIRGATEEVILGWDEQFYVDHTFPDLAIDTPSIDFDAIQAEYEEVEELDRIFHNGDEPLRDTLVCYLPYKGDPDVLIHTPYKRPGWNWPISYDSTHIII